MKTSRIIPVVLVALLSTACNKFLDKLPDDRAEIDGTDKLTQLLTSAYPTAHFSLLGELSSDNVADNGAQYNVAYPQVEEVYLWEDGTYEESDTNYDVWEASYQAIASANHALQYIEEQGSASAKALAPYKAEALLCRAYSHFVLVNIFCQHYSELTSGTDMGIPYVEEPETTVQVKRPRGTVKEVYEKIDRDINAALPDVSDDLHKVPKYHFTVRGANAFAARFNLYYRKDMQKVIDCATIAVGDPNKDLRIAAEYKPFSSQINYANFYVHPSRRSNLLILPCRSMYQRVWCAYSICTRYTHGITLANQQTVGSTGIWNKSSENYLAFFAAYGSTTQRRTYPKVQEWFVQVDENTGRAYSIYMLFTTDEALLTRAEAYAYTGQNDKALADLTAWNVSHGTVGDVTMTQVNGLYGSGVAYNELTKKTLNPDFAVAPGDQEALIHAILHVRRLETLADGLRWFDVKRYGITVTHNYSGAGNLVNAKDDLRRAIQIPEAVLSAGMEKNPR